MANVTTLAEVKTNLGITSSSKDSQITALLPGISREIERHTSREFTLEASGPATSRSYWYPGDGILEIGDCTTITDVAFEGRSLSTDEWIAMPNDALEPVFYWLELTPIRRLSPEMGFEWNLDRLWPKYRAGRRRIQVTVTATWGFPTGGIPADVKLAAAWMVEDATNGSQGGAVSSESIADYAVSFAQQGQKPAMSSRVKDILDGYRRTNI